MWKIISSVITGSSHIKSKKSCQDVVNKKVTSSGCIIVLADGASSSQHSELGASISCSSIIHLFLSDFNHLYQMPAINLKFQIIHNIRTRLGIKAKKYNTDKEQFASTLLFVTISDDKFIAGHIGDGVIGYINNDNVVELLSGPENGEYANTTFFTTSNHYKHHLRLYKGSASKIKSFFLMSDGAGECLYDKCDKTFASAILSFSTWLDLYSESDVNKALHENMLSLFPKYTSDDCGFIMCQNA